MAGAGMLFFCPADGSIFLARRSAFVSMPGVWGLPGGTIEPGESPIAAAVREAIEEVGSVPDGAFLSDVASHGGYTTFVAIVPARTRRTWRPRLNWENDHAGWFTARTMPAPIHPGVARVLAR